MIKKIVLPILFIFFCGKISAQTDTLFTKAGPKVPCKVIEIGETEIKYKKAENPDGPTYAIGKPKVREIVFANGTKELITHDELSMAPDPSVLQQRQVYKIHPFSPIFNCLVVGYERVLKVGTNLDVQVGYINSDLNPKLYGGVGNSQSTTGGFVQGGVKFLLGQDYYVNGMKYTHPLKGRYVRLEGAFSAMKISNMLFYGRNYQNGYWTTTTYRSDASALGYGLFITYGRQWVLGNIVTLDYYLGVGAAGSSVNYNGSVPTQNIYDNRVYNYYAFTTTGAYFSFTYGLALGLIRTDKAPAAKAPVTPR